MRLPGRYASAVIAKTADHSKENEMSHYDLSGRFVAITGAIGGLGSALARELLIGGARLVLFDAHRP